MNHAMNKNKYIRKFNIIGLLKFYTFKILKIKCGIFKTLIGDLYLDTINDGISKSYAYWGIRETDKHQLISEEIREGDYIIDCGSNIGGYAKFFENLIGNEGKIVCIEPDNRNHKTLMKNFESLKCKKKLFLKALSSDVSKIFIQKEKKTNLSKISMKYDKGINGSYVETINLEYLINNLGSDEVKKFKLIRMDIEGHEVEVLDNISKNLEYFSNLDILFEVHTEYYDLDKFRNILNKFRNTHSFAKLVSAGNSKLERFGQKKLSPNLILESDGFKRGLYRNIEFSGGIDLVLTLPREVRYAYLKRNNN